jgi:glycosyltransferase involved in cell wall biosynthesis
MTPFERTSVLIPAYEEEGSIAQVIEAMRSLGPWKEIIVVDDGSRDETAKRAETAGAKVVRHPYNKGNGAAVKSALRAANGDYVLLMDADGQHDPSEATKLTEKLGEYDLVVGSRSFGAQAGMSRALGNAALNRFATALAEFPVSDLTSGFRAASRPLMMEFVHLFPNGFSYPATSTLAFVKAGYNVCFVPVEGKKRSASSKSKMRPFREGGRFLMIVLRLVSLFSPLRVFLPFVVLSFSLGFGYMVYTIVTEVHVTNTSVLLIIGAIVMFLFGMLAEGIATLRFERKE